ncbi:malic enzyme [Coleophoma crateriformis]|uniref:Malic enzyme n=1 Tax=Coleophoma crateriformis TaxID=565419 RepID=A0A3D8QE28_9HELO|nr:malic enzyme [Coleophoma crateriformis]
MSPKSLDTSHGLTVRKDLKTHGLVPPNVESHEIQSLRVLKALESKKSPIEKYLYLSHLRNHHTHLFYRLLSQNLRNFTPLIYTPVVGEACQRWSEIYQQAEGLYISYSDRGSIAAVLGNWPERDVEITVVTDGSRILGLGDLGINGMGIPVGKLALYSGCAGIDPAKTLPLTLDLGTNNKALLADPLYMGSRMNRVSEEEEAEFLDELMVALTTVWPGIVIQFEDFKNPFPALERYQPKYAFFNDDIQGTGAVILAGVINALRKTGIPIKDQRAVFMGAGSAGVGVAKQIVEYFIQAGQLSEEDAKRCFWFVDTKGLITSNRGDKLAAHKVYFARHDNESQQFKGLGEVLDYVKPTMLMGLSTIYGVFTPAILKKMATFNSQPIVFPLSNPSNKSECTLEEAMLHTNCQAIVASGSPFPDYVSNGKIYASNQGNNMYVFPGIGLAAILLKVSTITSSMIYASATSLATSLTPEELAEGRLYPAIERIRDVSVVVARGVAREAQRCGADATEMWWLREVSDEELEAWIRSKMYDPFVAGVGEVVGRKSKL